MQINEKPDPNFFIEHFSVYQSLWRATVSYEILQILEIHKFPGFFHIICLGKLTFHKTKRNKRLIYSHPEKIP